MLDQEELAAIKGAVGQAVARAVRTSHTEPQDSTPIALIADDQASERARPDGLRLLARFCPIARARLLRNLGLKLGLAVLGAETVPGTFIKDELLSCWTQVI